MAKLKLKNKDRLLLGDEIDYVQFEPNRMVWRADHLIAEEHITDDDKIAIIMFLGMTLTDDKKIELYKLQHAEV